MVNLPTFNSHKKSNHAENHHERHSEKHQSGDPGANGSHFHPTNAQIKRATRTRRIWSILTSVFLFITVIFLIVVEIGNTHNRAVLTDIWFIKLELTNVIPTSVPNSNILNSIAQTLGLHDFYTVGLWGYCEGYNAQGVTDCSDPKTLYWFNPITIIQSELLAGSSIKLPSDIHNVLHLIEVASKIMFGFFLLGACLSFVLMFITPLSVISRWIASIISCLTFLNAAVIAIAAAIGTAEFIIIRNVLQGAKDTVNIGATIGITMFALMWVAAAFAIFAWVIQMGLMCCCASKRDVRKGKKRGSKKAYT